MAVTPRSSLETRPLWSLTSSAPWLTSRGHSSSTTRPSATECAKSGSTAVKEKDSREANGPNSRNCAARCVNSARSVSYEKSDGLLCAEVQPVVRYRWIIARTAEGYRVALACRAMQVSSSGYYEW